MLSTEKNKQTLPERNKKLASLCGNGGKSALWHDLAALSPISTWAVSQNLGTDILFLLGEAIDEEIRYFSDALLFFCREFTKPCFPSPIVFDQQETRVFHSKLQKAFQLGLFLKTFSYPFSYGCIAHVALAVCGLSHWLFHPHICIALSASCWALRMSLLLPQQLSIPSSSAQPFYLALRPSKCASRAAHFTLPHFMPTMLVQPL